MFRTLAVALFAFFYTATSVGAQQPTFYQLLPDSVQAAVWVRNAEELSSRWNRTLLHELANDPKVKDFFQEQHESIQKKLMEAGWRLGVEPNDLAQYLRGQVAVAWLEKAEARKPFALTMIADIDDDEKTTERMLSEIDEHLSQHKISKKQLTHLNHAITQYILPKRPGQLLEEHSFLTAIGGKLVVTDDLPLMQDLIAKLSGQNVAGKSLADDADFVEARKELNISDKSSIEYFVRPLGIAKVIRDIGGKRSRSGADLLVVLKNQGFTAIKCVAGEIWIGEGDVDVSHRGFVLADFPLPKAAAVLDFPNQALVDIPKFVGSQATSFLATKWNSQEAFWKIESLFDELAGTPGTFAEVINGFKNDPNGPQIEVRTEVLPLLTNDIVAVTDNQPGEVQLNSRRNLIAVKVNDGPRAAKIVDRVFKQEAKAQLTEHANVSIWEISNELDSADEEFAELGFEEPEDEAADQGLLSQWAICVHDGWIMFSSHSDMLRSAIDQVATDKDGLADQADFTQTRNAILQLSNEDPCAWKIARNQLAYKVQYELFRQGKLQESESMLATILEKIVDNNSELKNDQPATIKGDSLPPYEDIAKYLRPSGFKLVTTENGWSFGGLLIGRKPDVTTNYDGGTARFDNTAADAKR